MLRCIFGSTPSSEVSTIVNKSLALLLTNCLFVIYRWVRRYITRVRLFYARREYYTEMLQCCARQFLSRNRLVFLRRRKAAIELQCMWRQRLARNKKRFKIDTIAATVIQAYIRRYSAIMFCIQVRHDIAARNIQKWTRSIMAKRRQQANAKIVKMAWRWLQRRNVYARRVTVTFRRNYLRRSSRARIIGR